MHSQVNRTNANGPQALVTRQRDRLSVPEDLLIRNRRLEPRKENNNPKQKPSQKRRDLHASAWKPPLDKPRRRSLPLGKPRFHAVNMGRIGPFTPRNKSGPGTREGRIAPRILAMFLKFTVRVRFRVVVRREIGGEQGGAAPLQISVVCAAPVSSERMVFAEDVCVGTVLARRL